MSSVQLDKAPSPARLRTQPARTAPGPVDREGRVITGVSVITRGEALGHGLWIDTQFLNDVARLGAQGGRGLKSRFTHPGLSSDGTGKALGRAHNLARRGDQVVGDLHLLKAAENAPDGNLSGYVMDLAEEDPEIFGTSIVFMRDRLAECSFREANTRDLGDGEGDRFVSPDPLNVENLRHARIAALKAVDVVDDPAANPGGFFSAAGDVAEQATGVLAFALGLTEQSPGADAFGGVHPDRARQFVTRFLSSRGLTLEHREEVASMAAKNETDAAPKAAAPPAKRKATVAELSALYSADFVVESLTAGRSVEEAETAWDKKELARLKAENESLRTAPKAPKGKVTGAPPINFGGRDGGHTDFLAFAREIRDESHPNLTSAQRACGVGMKEALALAASRDPEAYRAHARAGNPEFFDRRAEIVAQKRLA